MRQMISRWLIATGVFAGSAFVCAVQAQAPPPGTTPSTIAPVPPVTAPVAPDTSVAGSRLHGVVKSGNVPLPGVTVTAQNTLTGKRYATTTDVSGTWSMTIPQNGRYVIRTQFAAFVQGSQEALFNASSSRDQAVNFDISLASRAAAQSQQVDQAQAMQAIRQLAGSGPQNLSLMSALSGDTQSAGTTAAGGNGAVLPSIAGSGDFGGDSVSITGQTGQVSPMAGVDMDRVRDAMETMRAQGGIQGEGGLFGGGGGFGGAFGGGFVGGPGGGGPSGGRGGPGGGGGRGNFRGFNPGQPHGAIFWIGSNSALNAQPFSPTGQTQDQPANGSNRFGLTFMSAPYIPGLTKPSNKDTVFLTLSGIRSSSPSLITATVPTDAQRAGDLGNGYNVKPVPQATALLAYVPEPNIAANSQGLNYQLLTTAQTNTTQVGARYLRSLGTNATQPGLGGVRRTRQQNQGLRQSISANYNFIRTASDTVGILPILGGKTASDSYSLQAGYTLGYKKLTNIFNVSWNRADSSTTNYFTNGADIATQLGILGPDGEALNSNPLNYGLPNVAVTGFSGFPSEVQPALSISQTISLSETLSWIHGKHNFRFGGDYRRVHRDFLGRGSATGAFTFTGQYFENANLTGDPNVIDSIAGLADFLTGAPQQTSISAAENKSYLRDNVFDGYANDDWRIWPSLSINYGVRYDFYAPYNEKYNRMAMVDTNPNGGFTNVGQVVAGATSPNYGPIPDSLVYPYRVGFSPRFGMAWRVPKMKQMVVRAGYGLNYTVGEYSTFASNFAYQPPFVNEQTNLCASATPCYSLADGFVTSNPQGTYALDPRYRVPHVQVYNLDVQKTLPWDIVLNVGYNGSIGGNMDIKIAPRATPSSPNTDPGVVPFYYLESGAFYHFNAGTVRLNKRLTKGFAVGANYQWSHAIDNAGGVGGSATTITAQNWQDIGAEVSNSTVDQRHKVSGTYLYELPFGKDKFWVTTGTASHILEGFSVSGTFTFATGTPLNLTYGSANSDAACGTLGNLRPQYTGESPSAGAGTLQQWFNPGAFTQPGSATSTSTQQNPYPCATYGNVPRNVLMGPGTVTNNMSLSKTVQMGDTRSWEFRATASNAFNTVQYSTVDTNVSDLQTFGRVLNAAQMRQFNFTTRFRF
jgi:trimeric autotransporter adhesin